MNGPIYQCTPHLTVPRKYLYSFLLLKHFLCVCVNWVLLVYSLHCSPLLCPLTNLDVSYKVIPSLPPPTHSVVFISQCGVAAEVRVREALRQTRSSAPGPTGRQSTATGRAIVFSLPETGQHLPWRSEAVCMPVQSQCPPRAQTGQGTNSRAC